jgi:hypothetical protein
MKTANRLALTLAGLVSALPAAEYQDWRLQLMEQEGLAEGAAGLQVLEKGIAPSEERLKELVQLLADEDFATREQSQKEILRMGVAARPWLDRLPESGDPEVRLRIGKILGQLGSKRRWPEAELLQYAVASLRREKDGKEKPAGEPLVFAELFHDKADALDGKYRGFRFEASPGLSGKVGDGKLRFSGRGPIDGDQRLILPAKEITGKEVFPDRFRIEVMLGGTAGGQGSYHLGVSLGKVRALFHPGYAQGAFRFEHIDTHKALMENANMGFTPATDSLAIMALDVKRLPGGDVELQVTVIPGGKADGRKYTVVRKFAAADIGKLDFISLDRSGRTGGDALFDNLVVEIDAR